LADLPERAAGRGDLLATQDATASALGRALMEALYFTPYRMDCPVRVRGCLTCTHFHAPLNLYAMGCAFWIREPGADDE
jgi:hypothetical protein